MSAILRAAKRTFTSDDDYSYNDTNRVQVVSQHNGYQVAVNSRRFRDDAKLPNIPSFLRKDVVIYPKPIGQGGKGIINPALLKITKKYFKQAAVKGPSEPPVDQETAETERHKAYEHVNDHMLKLNHKNIVKYFGVYELYPRVYIVMERLKGGTLDYHVRHLFHEISFRNQINICHQAALAHKFVHSQGMCVGDFKLLNAGFHLWPDYKSNSFVLKLFDLTNTEHTTRYSSPAALGGEFSSETDIYTFAIVACEVFSGRFYMLSRFDIMQGKRPEIPYFLPDRLQSVINRSLQAACSTTWNDWLDVLHEMGKNVEYYESICPPRPHYATCPLPIGLID